MSVGMILDEIEAAGIALRIDGEKIRIRFQEPQQREMLAPQVAFLRAHRDEVAEYLRVRELSDGGRGLYFWGSDRDGTPRDYYGWRTHVALDAICQIPAPEGLAVWLGKNASFLYRKLLYELPNKISRAWDSRISYKAFDALCFELVDTYRRAADLYAVVPERRKLELLP
jgi:hypothetical protein